MTVQNSPCYENPASFWSYLDCETNFLANCLHCSLFAFVHCTLAAVRIHPKCELHATHEKRTFEWASRKISECTVSYLLFVQPLAYRMISIYQIESNNLRMSDFADLVCFHFNTNQLHSGVNYITPFFIRKLLQMIHANYYSAASILCQERSYNQIIYLPH